jgi:hypothetical protein
VLIASYISNSVSKKKTRYSLKIKDFGKNKGYNPKVTEPYIHNHIKEKFSNFLEA